MNGQGDSGFGGPDGFGVPLRNPVGLPHNGNGDRPNNRLLEILLAVGIPVLEVLAPEDPLPGDRLNNRLVEILRDGGVPAPEILFVEENFTQVQFEERIFTWLHKHI